jgi:hypothetical protein
MKFDQSTPRESAQFQGFKIEVPQFFDGSDGKALLKSIESHSIPVSVIAAVLQQTLGVEGPRNNVAKTIKEDVITPALASLVSADPARFSAPQGDLPPLCTIDEATGTITLTWDGKIESLPDDVKSHLAETCTPAAQAAADAYFAAYIPAQPKRKGVSGPSLDPVEDLARQIFRDSIYASWADASFKDITGKVWTGVKSHDRAGSSHQAANLMLAAGQIPAFLDKSVFDRFDGDITSVKSYVEAYVELLFASDKPAGKAKVERLREMAKERLARAAKEAQEAAEGAAALLG